MAHVWMIVASLLSIPAFLLAARRLASRLSAADRKAIDDCIEAVRSGTRPGRAVDDGCGLVFYHRDRHASICLWSVRKGKPCCAISIRDDRSHLLREFGHPSHAVARRLLEALNAAATRTHNAEATPPTPLEEAS